MTGEAEMANSQTRSRLLLITGPSGAGRSTAIAALEDLGYEAIDNMPLSLLPRLLEGPPLVRPIALGVDARNRDFDVSTILRIADALSGDLSLAARLVYIDCHPEVLLRRYSETRRQHPMAPGGDPVEGIDMERAILQPLRERADEIIDTTELSPHELRVELEERFGLSGGGRMGVTVKSFSYKRGIPAGTDMAIDCRFLRNPHWEPALRAQSGLDEAVASYVFADPAWPAFHARIGALLEHLLPAYVASDKAHFTLAFGCTGGRHRSVAVAAAIGADLARAGWRVSIRHVELDRR